MRLTRAITILVVIFFFSCDTDIYFGYQNRLEESSNTTEISGRVMDFYNRKPVSLARIGIGSQETYSNDSGFYSLRYVLNENELRNKPTPVLVSKKKYSPIQFERILDPVRNQMDFDLKYAAPLIMGIARFPYQTNKIAIQTIVKDYQGVYTIDSVRAVVFYEQNGALDSVLYDLKLVGAESVQVGYFQTTIANALYLKKFLFITVKDRDGYRARLFRPTKKVPDRPLFPPD